MNINLPDYKRANIAALVAAVILHSGVAAWALQPSSPVAMPAQVIKVNFVAPSSEMRQKQEVSENTKEVTISKPKPDGIKQAKKEPKKQKAAEDTKESIARKTSGKQADDATATNSAETEPVFNAEYLNNPVPSYPDAAKRRGVQGKVLLFVMVNTDGTVESIKIDHSSGSTILDKSALDAVRYWKFIPARSKGEIVQASVIVPVEFKLN
jgi:protein TonB